MLKISALAQTPQINFDETRVPSYSLPDPLLLPDGKRITSQQEWEKHRQAIFSLFESHVYGVSPPWKHDSYSSDLAPPKKVFNGKSIRKQILLTLVHGDREVKIVVLMYLPVKDHPCPVFLGFNFFGNHTITTEADVCISPMWLPDNSKLEITANAASEVSRGKMLSRWPVEEIINRGYGLATVYYGDIDPDFDDGFKNGVHGLFEEKRNNSAWGSIAAWAWGLSRVVDFLSIQPEINSARIIVTGHSRLGKAALWAGACDSRIAMVISNNSGCGGAAIFRRKFGETVDAINRSFPHWFCAKFKDYNGEEERLPIDQHELIGLMAPRPVYIASATEDLWADPKGEFLAAREAGKIYQLYNREGVGLKEMPAPGKPAGDFIGYHLRTGRHDITIYDWKQFMNFADKHFRKQNDKKSG